MFPKRRNPPLTRRVPRGLYNSTKTDFDDTPPALEIQGDLTTFDPIKCPILAAHWPGLTPDVDALDQVA